MAEPFSEAQLEDFRAAYVTAAEDSAITVRDAGRLLATIDQLQADLDRVSKLPEQWRAEAEKTLNPAVVAAYRHAAAELERAQHFHPEKW